MTHDQRAMVDVIDTLATHLVLQGTATPEKRHLAVEQWKFRVASISYQDGEVSLAIAEVIDAALTLETEYALRQLASAAWARFGQTTMQNRLYWISYDINKKKFSIVGSGNNKHKYFAAEEMLS